MNPVLLDIVVLAVVLLSALLAFVRGFTREIFSLLAWIGGAAAAWLSLPWTEPYAREIVDDALAARIIAAVAVFIAVLFAVTLIGLPITGRIRESGLRALDRTLGGLFGVARGAVLVVLFYVVLLAFYPKDSRIAWLEGAISTPYLVRGAAIAERVLPKGMVRSGRRAARDLRTGAGIGRQIEGARQPQGDAGKNDDAQ